MKALFITTLALAGISCIAQANDTYSFWVIESNTKNVSTIIRFYDQQNNLIHQDTVSGKRLEVTKRKHRKLLDRKLKEVLKQESVACSKTINKD
jgi:uncharacterized protein (DUF2344 family)